VLAARGRQVFEERFTLQRSVEAMVQLYRQVLTGAECGGSEAS
jgi:hypothetical protein